MKKLLALVMVLLLTFSFSLVACDEVLENGDGVIADGSNSANDVNDAEEKTEVPENETPEADENTAFDPATITPEKLYANIVKELSNVDNVTYTIHDVTSTTSPATQIDITTTKALQVKYDGATYYIPLIFVS